MAEANNRPSRYGGGLRVRFHIIGSARSKHVGESQSCMVSKLLPMMWKQTVSARSGVVNLEEQAVYARDHCRQYRPLRNKSPHHRIILKVISI